MMEHLSYHFNSSRTDVDTNREVSEINFTEDEAIEGVVMKTYRCTDDKKGTTELVGDPISEE